MTSQKTNILLADDNKANQFVSKAMLESVGATVVIAENGLEVLAMIKKQRFDLIFMDCQMPEMDGFEATTQIRASEDSSISSIPIVALTADAQKETEVECKRVGMNDFLSKPFTFDDLKKKIDKWA